MAAPLYLARSLEAALTRAASEFPAVVLTGLRQSGKTTLLRQLFSETHRYVSLDFPDVEAVARSDPRSFLAAHPEPVILDEIQHAAEILPYLRERIDADRGRRGRYILSGAQNLLLLEKVTESLAGRTAWLTLLPLSRRELDGRPDLPPAWERAPDETSREGPAFDDLWRRLLTGSYPEPALEPDRDLTLWHESYIRTYLERDVRSVRQVGDLTTFQAFLRTLASRTAGLLNVREISRDLGIAANTVKAWLSVLEATHQVFVIRPWFENIAKRLVKTPKIYFTDTGTVCRLCGISDPAHLRDGPMGGAVLETAVLGEILKTLTHRGETPRVSFFRTSDGREVDFVVEVGDRLVPIEVTATATPRPAMTAGIRTLREWLGDRVAPGYVVHPGDTRLPLGAGDTALPFRAL